MSGGWGRKRVSFACISGDVGGSLGLGMGSLSSIPGAESRVVLSNSYFDLRKAASATALDCTILSLRPAAEIARTRDLSGVDDPTGLLSV